jgi:hypothetical protein
MPDNRCKATTTSGEQCRLPSGGSGYCHIHDPDAIAKRQATKQVTEQRQKEQWAKGNRLREVIEVVESTSRAKGWTPRKMSLDKSNWRYATIAVARSTSSSQVTGIIEVSLAKGFRISYESTSFYRHGLQDLFDALKAELDRLTWINLSKKKAPEAKPFPSVETVESLLQRFHLVARQITRRHDNRETLIVQDEYDAQDLLHALLKALFDDVRPEDVAPIHAGASSRVDFLLKAEKIVIEVKVASKSLKDKKIGEQLIVDIERYQSHPDCETLVCFVYDPQHCIENPVALENDLSGKRDKLDVRVLVVPQ